MVKAHGNFDRMTLCQKRNAKPNLALKVAVQLCTAPPALTVERERSDCQCLVCWRQRIERKVAVQLSAVCGCTYSSDPT